MCLAGDGDDEASRRRSSDGATALGVCARAPARREPAGEFYSENFLIESCPAAKSCARPHRALFETTHRRRDAQFLACRSSSVEQMSNALRVLVSYDTLASSKSSVQRTWPYWLIHGPAARLATN